MSCVSRASRCSSWSSRSTSRRASPIALCSSRRVASGSRVRSRSSSRVRTSRAPCSCAGPKGKRAHAYRATASSSKRAGVAKHFGGVLAVTDVDLEVRRGEILGIIGPNGAGKSTFVNICSGFLTPDAGVLRFEGRDITHLGAAALAEDGIGRTFQDAKLWPSLTVREALAVALDRHVDVRDPLACAFRGLSVVESEKEIAVRVELLLEETGLVGYRDTFVSELSTGTRRILEDRVRPRARAGSSLLRTNQPAASPNVRAKRSESYSSISATSKASRSSSLNTTSLWSRPSPTGWCVSTSGPFSLKARRNRCSATSRCCRATSAARSPSRSAARVYARVPETGEPLPLRMARRRSFRSRRPSRCSASTWGRGSLPSPMSNGTSGSRTGRLACCFRAP